MINCKIKKRIRHNGICRKIRRHKSMLVEQVFGVSKDPVLSYVEREEVDGLFVEAIKTDKQIIVYGASKQGKTSLVGKHISYKENVVVSLTPKFSLIDIYKSILSSLGVEIITNTTVSSSSELGTNLSAKIKAVLPVFSSQISSEISSSNSTKQECDKKQIELNLELPNDVAKAINEIKKEFFIILENFHYLSEDIQQSFAFDLRSFQELGVRFIILGVWREKNRLIQFNGDLLDRIFEIPVEPWTPQDFMKVISKGEELLNICIDHDIKNEIVNSSFDSIGVVQELLKDLCKMSGVHNSLETKKKLEDRACLDAAKREKASYYSARHIRALEAIAEGLRSTNNPKSEDIKSMPLYLPYYTVKCILSSNFSDIESGIKRNDLEVKIKEIHHRPNDVRPSDMSNLLHNLAKLQSEKAISPPIFDYDKTTKTIRIINSTFYFFVRNADTKEILEQIPDPTSR